MVIKLNSYTLSDNSIGTMRNALDRSRHIKKEIGLTMCSKQDNVITLRGEHEGEENRVSINRQCNEGEKYVGYYHAHHKDTSKATSGDLAQCGTSKILCVGGTSEQEIQKGQINDNVTCHIWKDKVISVQKGVELFINALRGEKEPHSHEHKSHLDCLNTIGKYALEQLELDNEYKSIGLAPMRKLSILSRFRELNTRVEQETDKYYNRTEIKLRDE